MVNIKNTLDELKDILNIIKTKQDANTAWTGTEKTDIEKRINHLYDKSKPRHTNLAADLDIDLSGIENINKMIGDEKLRTDAEIKKLTDDKKTLEEDITAKEALIKQKDEQIGGKITQDLIDKLEAVSKMDFKKQPKKNADGTDMKDKDGNIIYEEVVDLAPLKTLLEEIKTKEVKTDLTDITSKVNALTDKADQIKTNQNKGIDGRNNYWSIGACVSGVISVFLLAYVAFLKPSSNVPTSRKEAKEEVNL